MTVPLQVLPQIALQPSTSSVYSDVADPDCDIAVEDVWISFYRQKQGEEAARSLHGKLRITETDQPKEVEVTVREGSFEVTLLNPNALQVSCDSLSIPSTRLLLPSSSTNVPAPTSSKTEEIPAPSFYSSSTGIDCFAISNDRKRIVLGSRDGQCRVVEVVAFEDASHKKIKKGKEVALRGHVGDITCVEFFPSNEVVLTASSDMSLRVFSTKDGTCPRHLQGHTKRVTGTHILVGGEHKGREVLSSSLDGTLKLWDLSTGQNTQTWTLPHPISALEVISSTEVVGDNVLEGKIALCGHSDGTISKISLFPSEPTNSSVSTTFKSSLNTSSIESLSYNPKTRILAAGSRNGIVGLFEISEDSPSEVDALTAWRRTEGSSINSVEWHAVDDSLLIASSDGLPYRVSIDRDETSGRIEVRLLDEFVGSNCDPCTEIFATAEGNVWISGGSGDGTLRVYEL
ncbi:hypothetical protein JCM5350_004677 [Sporobolomyces pararoseus]